MHIANIIECNIVPSIGALLGATGRPTLLQALSADWSGGGVVFGMVNDPFKDRCRTFLDNIVNQAKAAGAMIKSVANALTGKDVIVPITKEEDLSDVPPAMWIPIMTHPTMRQLLVDDRVYGFGLTPDMLPEEDIAGRLIDNGAIRHIDPKNKEELFFEWTWKSNDPKYSFEELDALEATREFIVDKWLAQQLGVNGSKIDPTNYPEKMSKIK